LKLTARANEVAAVKAVLLSDEYDDETAMAKACIAALAAELSRRDWYVMPWSLPGEGGGVNYGPFATLTELRRAAGAMPAGEHKAVLVLGPDRSRTHDSQLVSGACVCGHQPEQHVVRNVRGGKVSKPAECGIYTGRRKCACSDYTEKGKA
jgi:hypothetical protein